MRSQTQSHFTTLLAGVTAEEEEENDEEDLSAIAEPSGLTLGPCRTSLKVNSSLEAALVGVPNIRTTNFNSKPQLALE